MAACKRRGLQIAPFKVGPDFIDPGHHRQVTASASHNLDGWMLSQTYNLKTFNRHCIAADIAVIEGVMGLFDGYDGRSEAGSTAQMAKWLGVPVLLVVDARRMARSAAAIVQGFERFDPELSFAGVVFNQVGSSRHLTYLRDALEAHGTLPCLGGIPRNQTVSIPERHLGLLTRQDHQLSAAFQNQLADLVETHLDLDRLLIGLPHLSSISMAENQFNPSAADTCIGIAQDAAFCFYYPENLELLQHNGARLRPFSPMETPHLPEDIDGLYFGGGYPEVYAQRLAANRNLRRQIQQMSRAGMPIYGECGGLMYLSESIEDFDGQHHDMTACLPFTTRMLPRLKQLGYRNITLTADTLLGAAGNQIRGHEFHYSEIANTAPKVATHYRVRDRRNGKEMTEGYQVHQTLGSYIHLHWGSHPEAAKTLVAACRKFRKERKPSP